MSQKGKEYQPKARDNHSTVRIGDDLYMWGGYQTDLTYEHDSEKKQAITSFVEVCHLPTGKWEQKPTKGKPPLGVWGYASAVIGNDIFFFGGACNHDNCHHNSLYSLNVCTLEWREHFSTSSDYGPKMKRGASMVEVQLNGEVYLAIVGGCGPLTNNPLDAQNVEEHFNEIHYYCPKTGKWMSPTINGDTLPPVSSFTLTSLTSYSAVLFGGATPDGPSDSIYFVKFTRESVDITKLSKPEESVEWPEARDSHSSVLINNRSTGPQLLVVGGKNNSDCCNDCWLFDINEKIWNQLDLPENVAERYDHSLSVWNVSSSISWIIMNGGRTDWSIIQGTKVIELKHNRSNKKWSVVIVPSKQHQDMIKKEHKAKELNETREKIKQSSQPDAITSKADPSGHNNSNKKSSAAIVPSEEYQDKLEQAQKANKELNNGNLKKWISEGFVELTLTRVQMLGPPGSGKTCSQHLLLNEDPPLHKNLPLSSEAENESPSKSITDSTPIACRAVKAIRISCNDDKTLKRITRDELLQKLASNLKNEGERRKRELSSAPTHPSGASRAGKSKQELVINSATNKSEGEQVSLLQASIGNAGKGTQEQADAGKHTQEQADLAISENLNPSVPPPEEEVETSDVLEEIIKLIPQAKARQLTDEWVYIIDSGGQPAFQELLPLFTRAASLNVVTLDISKPLDEEYPYPYHVNGMLFNSDEELKYTNRKHFESSVLSGIFNQKPLDLQCVTTETPEHTMYFVLGTHYDEFEKMHAGNVESKLTELNDELAESLPTSIRKKYIIYDRHKSMAHKESNIIIFPFNTLLPAKTDERDKASKCLSNAILKCSEVSLKMQVPIRWFVFELQLEGKAQSTEGLSFVTKKEAIEEGKKLKMNEAEVEEVLQYLHNCTIILYYPNVEPVQLVFVNPNRILEALSHLLILRFTDHVTAQSFAKSMTLKERHNIHEGIFEKSLLKKFTKVFSGEFQPEYFINLLKHLHIIVELPGHKYFLPCALPAYDIRDFKIPETTIKPLRFVWCIKENEWGPGYVPVPQGSFPLMIVFLLKQKECPVCFNKADGIKQFRDMVSFLISFKKDCEPMQKLYIVKCSKYIEVTYIGQPEHCPKLRDTVKTAINKSLKAINAADGYLHSAFACLHNKEHSCFVNEDMKTYCRESSDHDCPFDDNYRCWFDKASTSDGSILPGASTEDTSIQADVAYKVMIEFAPRIKSCGIELNDLANKLLAKKIISHGKKEKVTDLRTGQTTSQRMDELLDAVMESVKVKATVFDYFLNILHEEDTIVTNALAEEMRKKYRSDVLKSNTF